MLVFLYQEGPYTKGVFRRSAGAKACRELRDRLDSGTEEPEITHQSVFVIAAVLKVKPPHNPHPALSPIRYQTTEGRSDWSASKHPRPDGVMCVGADGQAGSQTRSQGAALFSFQAKQEQLRCLTHFPSDWGGGGRKSTFKKEYMRYCLVFLHLP